MINNYIQFACKELYNPSLAAGKPLPVMPGSLIFFGFFIIAIGLISLIYPRLFWYLRVGRKLNNVPPTSLYLLILRFGGVLAIALGLAMIYLTAQINQ